MIFDKSVVCPVLIGREHDLQRLDRLMTQSQEGMGQIALISGEAGIGKSRLVYEFANWGELRDETYRIFRGRATPARRR